MRESRTSGSVRGARDNPRPYRYPLSTEQRNTTMQNTGKGWQSGGSWLRQPDSGSSVF